MTDPTRREQRIKKFAEYDTCPRCQALPGNPCRERNVNYRRALDKPCHNRPKLPPASP